MPKPKKVLSEKELRVQKILNTVGHSKIARACGIDNRQTVKHWADAGKLPDTEYLTTDHPRRTEHAKKIARLAKCKKDELL